MKRTLTQLTLALLALAATGCGYDKVEVAPPPTPPPAPFQAPAPAQRESLDQRLAAFKSPVIDIETAGDDATLREFLSIARAVIESSDDYLGYAQIAPLIESYKTRESLAPAARYEIEYKLIKELLRVGEVDLATEVAERLVAYVRTVPGAEKPLIEAIGRLGVVYLRQAEVANCVEQHNAECCIFPLQGGGRHSEAQPAARARDAFLEALALKPDLTSIRWLYNIACMALGDYPDRVDPRYLVPPASLSSPGEFPRFTDVAAAAGVDAFNTSGGAIFEDFDGDGDCDLFTTSIGLLEPALYYENVGGGKFVDRSKAANVANQLGGLNCLAADYDNDADMDILILRGAWMGNFGKIRLSLLANDGKGVFTDVTRQARISIPAFPTQAAAFGDLDNDGDLDLFIGSESRAEIDPKERDFPCRLYWNQGDGTFAEDASAAGVTNGRFTKGVALGDYDNDGWLDLYISNIGPNRLYRNNRDRTFTDVAVELGVDEPRTSSFVCWFYDYDNDGWLDLHVNGYLGSVDEIARFYLGEKYDASTPVLYRNTGGKFENVTKQVGLDRPSLPMGSGFGDINGDGYLEFYLATGNPDYETLTPNIMYLNEGGQRFRDVTFDGGFGHLQKGHAVAFADYDDDGDQDIFEQLGGAYPGDGFKNALFQNPGPSTRRVIVDLRGKKSNRRGVGARIEVKFATPSSDRSVHRAVGCVSGFGGAPIRQEIYLGDATRIEEIIVLWPLTGARQVFKGVELDSRIVVEEE